MTAVHRVTFSIDLENPPLPPSRKCCEKRPEIDDFDRAKSISGSVKSILSEKKVHESNKILQRSLLTHIDKCNEIINKMPSTPYLQWMTKCLTIWRQQAENLSRYIPKEGTKQPLFLTRVLFSEERLEPGELII